MSSGATKHSEMGKQRNLKLEALNPLGESGRVISASLGHDADMCRQASEGGGQGRLCCEAGRDMSCAHVHASSIQSCAPLQAPESEKGSGKIDGMGETRSG